MNKTEERQIEELAEIKGLLQRHFVELKKRADLNPNSLLDASIFLLEESIDLYGSLTSLYKDNYLRSCVIIARSILEASISLQYIYKNDADKRASNFILFSRKTALDRLKKANDSGQIKEEHILWFEDAVRDYSPSGKGKGGWDRKSIRNIFEELELVGVYDEWYSRLSNYTHVNYVGNRDLSLESPYRDRLKKFIFRDVFLITLEALRLMNEKLDLLEGGVVIHGYPKENMMYFFSINKKATEAELRKENML